MTEREWLLRLDLAACYRLVAWMGWSEMIFNHITLRVSEQGETPAYLINPYGLHYAEVTASNLVKVDIDGNKLDDSPWPINPAGFVIHSAIHSVREDAHCILHLHTTAGMAVACKEEGLRPDNFYSAILNDRIAYHDFEGITTDLAEQSRLQASLGTKDILILRNHGTLVVGGDVPTAFHSAWTLERACQVQMAADSMAGPNRAIPADVLARIPAQRAPMRANQQQPRRFIFDAMLRHAGIVATDLA
ncbi:class II aldolase/adducin family protein [Variovorax sp. VNK109]|uniref:class II aldolase/adducin family protein n=1 Tax=Variovorax sp. VNK109 TaxID=3400919 RepID=UPI003BFCA74C